VIRAQDARARPEVLHYPVLFTPLKDSPSWAAIYIPRVITAMNGLGCAELSQIQDTYVLQL
jgi:hypothetical protein